MNEKIIEWVHFELEKPDNKVFMGKTDQAPFKEKPTSKGCINWSRGWYEKRLVDILVNETIKEIEKYLNGHSLDNIKKLQELVGRLKNSGVTFDEKKMFTL